MGGCLKVRAGVGGHYRWIYKFVKDENCIPKLNLHLLNVLSRKCERARLPSP